MKTFSFEEQTNYIVFLISAKIALYFYQIGSERWFRFGFY